MPTPITNQSAQKAYMVIELLRSSGEREFPMQLASCFFYVAAHDGCEQSDLIDAVNISHSSVSRNVSWLGGKHRLDNRKGLELVRRERNPKNYKSWLLFLTPKGRQWATQIENLLTVPT